MATMGVPSPSPNQRTDHGAVNCSRELTHREDQQQSKPDTCASSPLYELWSRMSLPWKAASTSPDRFHSPIAAVFRNPHHLQSTRVQLRWTKFLRDTILQPDCDHRHGSTANCRSRVVADPAMKIGQLSRQFGMAVGCRTPWVTAVKTIARANRVLNDLGPA
jgi:hypothetical protein